jgi:hypothetical protein
MHYQDHQRDLFPNPKLEASHKETRTLPNPCYKSAFRLDFDVAQMHPGTLFKTTYLTGGTGRLRSPVGTLRPVSRHHKHDWRSPLSESLSRSLGLSTPSN